MASKGITRTVAIVIVVIIILAAIAAGYLALSLTKSSSSNSAGKGPNTLTWYSSMTDQYLDPDVIYNVYDTAIISNTYEYLVWFNGSDSSQVIPWLASSFAISSNAKQFNFTLRQGITFQDGEQFNATSVYFSFYRRLVMDGSSPSTHGTQGTYNIQQWLNTSLSSSLSGPQTYNSEYVKEVLAQNYVQINGQYSVTLNLFTPKSSFIYLISASGAAILAPEYTMQHDLALWNESSTGYHLPYPNLSGSLTNQIIQYFDDEVATCNSGVTPKGCGATYLDTLTQGSKAGTGPYTITSYNPTTGDLVFTANPNYWGGPNHVKPQIQTVDVNYVSDQSTRELYLKSAVSSGQAVISAVTPANIYDFANRTSWLDNHVLESVYPGIQVLGPYEPLTTDFLVYETNVTNPYTGTFYTFQPFADLRFRLAFADAVNLTLIDQTINNNLGAVAPNAAPPAYAPKGQYNASDKPIYSYNPDESAQLLLSAMQNPLTSFTFNNGSKAPSGLFNNGFGCTSLGSNGKCANPIPQTIPLIYTSGDAVNEAIMEQIASTINNISSTYNMGLTVTVSPLPYGTLLTTAISSHAFMYPLDLNGGAGSILDFLKVNYIQGYALFDHWNITAMQNFYKIGVQADATNNVTGVIYAANQMNELANKMVEFVWTFYPYTFFVMTSNIHGFIYNPTLQYPWFAGLTTSS